MAAYSAAIRAANALLLKNITKRSLRRTDSYKEYLIF